jgi:hypothetical protein
MSQSQSTSIICTRCFEGLCLHRPAIDLGCIGIALWRSILWQNQLSANA